MLVLSKLLHVIGLVGILLQLLYQLSHFLRTNFMQVMSPAEQAQMQIEKIFFVFTTPLFWIFAICSLIGFLGVKRYKNNLSL